MVYSFQLIYDEIIDILDLKYITTKRTGYSLNPAICEITDINTTLKYILPDSVKLNVTIDDNRLKSNLKINQTLMLTKISFFSSILGFVQSCSGPLVDVDCFYQLIPGTYKNDRPNNIMRVEKVHLKCDCIYGSIVNGVRDPILDSFALSSLPGHKIYIEPKIELFKKVIKSVLSLITFYSEDDDHKPVDFNNETISCTCQPSKIY